MFNEEKEGWKERELEWNNDLMFSKREGGEEGTGTLIGTMV